MEDIKNTQEATMPSRTNLAQTLNPVKRPWQGTFMGILGIIGVSIYGIFGIILLVANTLIQYALEYSSQIFNGIIEESAQNIEISGYSAKDIPVETVDFTEMIPENIDQYLLYSKIFIIVFFVFQILMIVGFFKGKKLAVLISFVWLIANAVMIFMARESLFLEIMIVMAVIYAFFTYLHIACLKSKFYKRFI